jgi:7-carboxy-7-deazaguanine synthase
MSDSLKVTEIFVSLQGEAKSSGLLTSFVRLTGCPLRCNYCDSEYAFYGGQRLSVRSILRQVQELGAAFVCVTGGEPLSQPAVHPLMSSLCDQGHFVSLETSGALSIECVDDRVSVVMDLKTPGSGEVGRNLYSNIAFLRRKDQLKFVISDRSDYEWARFKISEYELFDRVGEILFSPCFERISPTTLANWVVADKLPVRFQVQLHKLLWGNVPGV